MAAPLIQRVEAKDAVRLGELHSAVWSELYPDILSPAIIESLNPATMAELWGRFVTRGEDYVQHVAWIGGEIVGFVGVGPGREPGYELGTELYFIVVAPEHRRGRVGSALLKAAKADYLWVSEANRTAQAFYKKHKFFPDSIRREGTLFGAPLPEIRMAR